MQVRLLGKQSVYLEIAEEYKRFINTGVLKADEKLPSCRALAVELGINPNTVERAYSCLESEGYIKTLPKKGAYVCRIIGAGEKLAFEAETQIGHLKEAGLSREDILKVVEKVFGG